MPMPLPEERVYYYELRECGNVLLCWLPFSELKKRVAKGEVARAILEDHPGGLDVEVTPSDLGYLKQRYALDLGLDPEDLLLAFEALTRSKLVKVHGEAEVSGKLVESLARKSAGEPTVDWDARLPISKDQAELVLRKNPDIQKRIDTRLRALKRGPVKKKASKTTRRGRGAKRAKASARAPRAEGLLPQVRWSKGDAPAQVFGRLMNGDR